MSSSQSKQMLPGLEEDSGRTTAGKGLNSLLFDVQRSLGVGRKNSMARVAWAGEEGSTQRSMKAFQYFTSHYGSQIY